uniref:Uncharacterized protein n=1 Tax=Anopheles atroparvus TaxID=41427 RepID=A0A182JET3_ANOAO
MASPAAIVQGGRKSCVSNFRVTPAQSPTAIITIIIIIIIVVVSVVVVVVVNNYIINKGNMSASKCHTVPWNPTVYEHPVERLRQSPARRSGCCGDASRQKKEHKNSRLKVMPPDMVPTTRLSTAPKCTPGRRMTLSGTGKHLVGPIASLPLIPVAHSKSDRD